MILIVRGDPQGHGFCEQPRISDAVVFEKLGVNRGPVVFARLIKRAERKHLGLNALSRSSPCRDLYRYRVIVIRNVASCGTRGQQTAYRAAGTDQARPCPAPPLAPLGHDTACP
jgi:hypothetical protein